MESWEREREREKCTKNKRKIKEKRRPRNKKVGRFPAPADCYRRRSNAKGVSKGPLRAKGFLASAAGHLERKGEQQKNGENETK